MVRKIRPAKNWTGEEDNNFEPDGTSDLDTSKIYRILGLGDASHLEKHQDPIFQILGALDNYTVDAYPTHKPIYAARREHLQNICAHARALADIFHGSGEESFLEIENNLARGLGQEPPADHHALGREDIKVSREISLFREFSADGISTFADLMEIALKEFPNSEDAPKRGRPDRTPLRELIIELGMIYEDATGQRAYEGFASDPETREYDSSFFRLAWEVVYAFDPKAAKSNNAFGSQIRKALANNDIGWQAVEFEHIEGDFDSGKD
ncbi:MAG: hypothetical protein GQ535_08785 [Rhodobacteraceae bacterium]|nr:hypothetical protein [Paracoccaceae bacterium]